MTITAAYSRGERAPRANAPHSRVVAKSARGVELWAALKSMGREGLRSLIERTCSYAQRFEEGFRKAGCEVLNDVVINQVLVSFGSAGVTQKVIRAGFQGRRHMLVWRNGVCKESPR